MNSLVKVAGILCIVTGLSATGIRLPGPEPCKPVYPDYFGNRIDVPDDNPATVQGIRLGRYLFYETALSANDRFSCATCHRQQLAFTDGKRFSAGVDGSLQARNTMSLVNLLWVRHFFWDGRARGLEQQADTPLTNPHEMGQTLAVSVHKLQEKKIYGPLFRDAFGAGTAMGDGTGDAPGDIMDDGTGDITGDRICKALAQFERTLISANSKYDQYLKGVYRPTASEANGIALFFGNPDPVKGIRGAACGHCHGGPKTFSELYHNNGLDSVPADPGREKITGLYIDRGRFRVATLRNIALTAPYMHDGRFTTLEEVVDHYNEHVLMSATLSPFLQNISNTKEGRALDLTAQEKKDLVAFLHLLTDSSFITDPRFSNPFNQ